MVQWVGQTPWKDDLSIVVDLVVAIPFQRVCSAVLTHPVFCSVAQSEFACVASLKVFLSFTKSVVEELADLRSTFLIAVSWKVFSHVLQVVTHPAENFAVLFGHRCMRKVQSVLQFHIGEFSQIMLL